MPEPITDDDQIGLKMLASLNTRPQSVDVLAADCGTDCETGRKALAKAAYELHVRLIWTQKPNGGKVCLDPLTAEQSTRTIAEHWQG